MVKDKFVIARGYIIPVLNSDITTFVELNFVNNGVKKIIISQAKIYPDMLDKNLKIFLMFVIWIHVINYDKLFIQEWEKKKHEEIRTAVDTTSKTLKYLKLISKLTVDKNEMDDLRFTMIESFMTTIPRLFLCMSDEFWEEYDKWKKSKESKLTGIRHYGYNREDYVSNHTVLPWDIT